MFEIIQRHVARGDLETLPRLLPQLTYVCIAPFMGAENAIALLEQQIRQQRKEGS